MATSWRCWTPTTCGSRDKLARQVALLEAHPEAELVYGSPLYWFGWTGDPGRRPAETRRPGHRLPAGTIVNPPELALASHPLGPRSSPCPSDLCFRRGLVDRVGGFEESFRGIYALYEDQAFLAKVYLAAPVLVTGERWLRYRQHPQSCVSIVTGGGHAETVRRFFLEWLVGYLRAADVPDARVRRAAHRALRAVRHPTLSRLEARGLAVAGRALRLGGASPVGWRRARCDRHMGSRGRAPFPVLAAFGSATSGGSQPLSREFGFDRGIAGRPSLHRGFLAQRSGDIRGRVLEIGDNTYTRRFGGGHVGASDVLHVYPAAGSTTIVSDLASGANIPDDAFDCMILTQTLHLLYDVTAGVRTMLRVLKPGGRAPGARCPARSARSPATSGARPGTGASRPLVAATPVRPRRLPVRPACGRGARQRAGDHLFPARPCGRRAHRRRARLSRSAVRAAHHGERSEGGRGVIVHPRAVLRRVREALRRAWPYCSTTASPRSHAIPGACA